MKRTDGVRSFGSPGNTALAGPTLVLLVVFVLLLTFPPMRASAGQGPEGVEPTQLLRVAFPVDDGSLTPYTFDLGYPLVTLVYDTLMWRDRDGIPRPWLARSVEAKPGHQLEIHLAEGARWHDGVPVTAADVVFTFRFVADHPHPRFSPQLGAIERIEATGPMTVVITLERPSLGFIDQPLSDVPILPAHQWQRLPPGQVSPEGLAVGSGPYRLVEHRPGQGYRFEANAEYFRGRPAVQTIDVPIIDEPDRTVEALRRREADVIPIEAGRRVSGVGIRTIEGDSYIGTALVFNLSRAPFDRPEVRRAVAAALDHRAIARRVGAAVPADRGYVHPRAPYASDEVLHTFDLAKARETLAPLGLGPIRVLAPSNETTKVRAARQVAFSLQRAGVPAQATALSREEFSLAMGEGESAPSFDLAISSTPALASYDPDFLPRVFGSDGQAVLNFAGYRSAAFDTLAQRVASASDAQARRAAAQEQLRLLATEVPVVPLFFSAGAYAYRPSAYDGWVFIKGTGILDKRSFVEPARPTTRPQPTAPEPASSSFTLAWAAGAVLALAGIVALVLRRASN